MKRCKECKSTEIQERFPAWFDANTYEFIEGGLEADVGDTYCVSCGDPGVDFEEFEPDEPAKEVPSC